MSAEVRCVHGLRLLPEPSECMACRYGEPEPCRDPACPCQYQPSADETEAFHLHLDSCERCRENPFDLCAVGKPLLVAAGEAAIPPLRKD